MFVLRGAAQRAFAQCAFAQPVRQTPAIKSVLRSASFQTQKPVTRAFHQSRLWLVEEVRKVPSESEPEPVAAVGSAESGEATTGHEIGHERVDPSEEAGRARERESTTLRTRVGGIAEQARDMAASAVQNTREILADGSRAAPPSSRNLYIGNLFYETTAAQLEAEFGRFGEVISSKVAVDNRGLSKGFGFVEFATKEQAEQAKAELDQKIFQGRRITVQMRARLYSPDRGTTRRGPNPPSDTLYIGNMSYQMSDRDLNDLFRDIRDVLDVRVAIDRRSGQPRGFAHADFVNVAAAQSAKEYLEKKVIYGRQLVIDFGSSKNKARRNQEGEDA